MAAGHILGNLADQKWSRLASQELLLHGTILQHMIYMKYQHLGAMQEVV